MCECDCVCVMYEGMELRFASMATHISFDLFEGSKQGYYSRISSDLSTPSNTIIFLCNIVDL